MRILQVSASLDRKGGAEIYLHLLAEVLAARGHETGLFGGSEEEEVDTPSRRSLRRPEFDFATLFSDGALSSAFREYLASFRPDLIHVHNLYGFPATFADELAKSGLPVLQTVHDSSLVCTNAWSVWGDGTLCEGGPGRKCFEHGCEANAPFDARMVAAAYVRLRIARRSIRAFLCPSEFIASQLRAQGLAPVHTVAHWADTASFGGRAAFEERLALHVREPGRVLFVGRLERTKGLEHLIAAWPIILRRVPEARLAIVGTGSLLEPLRTRVKDLNVSASVDFHGWLPHADVAAHLGRASVHVVPSIWCEASGLTCHDAMLAGVPTVASRIGGLPEAVQDGVTGLLCAPRDPADLAEKVLWLLTDHELREGMSERCVQESTGRSRDEHVDQVEAIYRRCVEDAVPPSATPDEIEAELCSILEQLNKQTTEAANHKDWMSKSFLQRQLIKLGRRLGSG